MYFIILFQDQEQSSQVGMIAEYVLQLYTDHTFAFIISADKGDNLIIKGQVVRNDTFDLDGQSFILKSDKLQGEISSQLSWGITWKFKLKVP